MDGNTDFRVFRLGWHGTSFSTERLEAYGSGAFPRARFERKLITTIDITLVMIYRRINEKRAHDASHITARGIIFIKQLPCGVIGDNAASQMRLFCIPMVLGNSIIWLMRLPGPARTILSNRSGDIVAISAPSQPLREMPMTLTFGNGNLSSSSRWISEIGNTIHPRSQIGVSETGMRWTNQMAL